MPSTKTAANWSPKARGGALRRFVRPLRETIHAVGLEADVRHGVKRSRGRHCEQNMPSRRRRGVAAPFSADAVAITTVGQHYQWIKPVHVEAQQRQGCVPRPAQARGHGWQRAAWPCSGWSPAPHMLYSPFLGIEHVHRRNRSQQRLAMPRTIAQRSMISQNVAGRISRPQRADKARTAMAGSSTVHARHANAK